MEFQIILVLCFVILSSSTTKILAVTKQQKLDRISALPGQPPVNFSQYSGYVTVDEKHGRALFYWLTEATVKAHKKPLVLWLNGGPGCSSIAYGASEEIGPFRINKTASSLYLNRYSWNREANIIFLESPAGVGFSYTNTSSDLEKSGDEMAANDALTFLIRWFQRFPQYKHRDFYLSGESYAGHYVPQLANKIYDYNNKSTNPIINLKGFIVGNALIDYYSDTVGLIQYWWTHSMISDHTYKAITKSCNFKSQYYSKACTDAIDLARDEIGDINPYSIYTDTCKTSTPSPRLNNARLLPRFSGYDPCSENYAEIFYNRPDVQKALHANTTRIPYKWTACSETVNENWNTYDYYASILPIYRKLIGAGLRIWVFSGDTDSVVPVTSTKLCLRKLHLKIKTPWYPWYSGGQVGGRTEVYEGLTFATVRGAGHEVPLFKPRRAFQLFRAFLLGKHLPKS